LELRHDPPRKVALITGITGQDGSCRAKFLLEKTTVPGEQERADLEKRLACVKTSLTSVRQLIESMAAEGRAT